MDDLISRRAAKLALCKAVHKDKPIPCDNQTTSCLWSGTRVCDYAREIDALPPVQTEIIHCKDCEHWKLQIGNVKGDGLGSCDFHNVNLVTGEGFCYWAERREK